MANQMPPQFSEPMQPPSWDNFKQKWSSKFNGKGRGEQSSTGAHSASHGAASSSNQHAFSTRDPNNLYYNEQRESKLDGNVAKRQEETEGPLDMGKVQHELARARDEANQKKKSFEKK